jgi:hypothetical protein
MMYSSGLVIQQIVDSKYFKHPGVLEEWPCNESEFCIDEEYFGISRFMSWPLENEDDDLSKTLTEDTEKLFNRWYDAEKAKYMLAVIPYIDLCLDYLAACDCKGIKTRVLFCRTDREFSEWIGEIPVGELLGYDYATSRGFYSTILDDLLPEPVNKTMDKHKALLNACRLFNSEPEVDAYIKDRQALVETGLEIEDDLDFCKFQLFDVKEKSLRL